MSATEEEGNQNDPFDSTSVQDDDILNLNVPFEKKDEVKPHGAQWDPGIKSWTVAGSVYKKNTEFFDNYEPKKRATMLDYAINA